MNVLLTLFLAFCILFGAVSYQPLFASPTPSPVPAAITITGTVPGCGDGVIQPGEECDGTSLNNHTCVTRGFFAGILSCNPNCTFNLSQCTVAPPPPPLPPPPPPPPLAAPPRDPAQTGVIFSGRAFPGSTVTILKDAQVAAVTVVDANANFRIAVLGLTAGNYIFSVYSEDHQGNRSSLLTFPVSITTGVTASIGGIFISPTLTTNKAEVRRGDYLAIFGQSAPNTEITIEVHSDEIIFNRVRADEDGIFLHNFDTSPLTMGQHLTRSRARYGGAISTFSRSVSFLVGTRNVLRARERVFLRGDLNNDGRVNLIDFSIAAFWHRRAISTEFAVIERERLNGDGRVDLVDFSIMAFYWTG